VSQKNIPTVLTIAGSDSGGGAGIQADLKTFSALQSFGMSAITAVTAQNTREVLQIEELSSDMIYNQIKAVATDIGIKACKTGMLSSQRIIETVARAMEDFALKNFVLDPVMVSKSGAKLIHDDAIEVLLHKLLPRACVVTPNIPEAEVMTGLTIDSEATIRKAAEKIAAYGAQCVVIKGGHLDGDPVDWAYSQNQLFAMPEKRVATVNTHGTGCTYSAAIAAFLAKGYTTQEAVRGAKEYVHGGIVESLALGQGHGPLHHFHTWYKY
jgi:hydroxymethylpyrimidine/phosphomethylpyrimidine kinase